MRKRNTQLNIRLTEAEMQKLKQNAAKAKYPVSNYVRALINGNSPKECPPIEYHLMMDDLEDCLVALCAQSARADYLVTRDTKGFSRSLVPVVSPSEWLALMEQRHALCFEGVGV